MLVVGVWGPLNPTLIVGLAETKGSCGTVLFGSMRGTYVLGVFPEGTNCLTLVVLEYSICIGTLNDSWCNTLSFSV